jgi:DNA recombination protein RmuC
VEFAVRLPGKADGESVYLPIDSKFPLTHYENLQAAAQSGGKEQEAEAQKALFAALQKMAGDIAEKYIVPPRTTDFAVMFLPTEGLYAEALREPGFADKLRREKKVLLTGPATLAALLNSLSAGFRTLAVQKRSGEVWKILAEVKQEFGKFGDALERAQNQIYTASNTLDALRNTRSRQLLRKLDKAESLEETATAPAVDKTE